MSTLRHSAGLPLTSQWPVRPDDDEALTVRREFDAVLAAIAPIVNAVIDATPAERFAAGEPTLTLLQLDPVWLRILIGNDELARLTEIPAAVVEPAAALILCGLNRVSPAISQRIAHAQRRNMGGLVLMIDSAPTLRVVFAERRGGAEVLFTAGVGSTTH